jgi:predicted ATPase
VSSVSQVIVATQSPELISYFNPEDIIVVDRTKENIEGKTFFHSSFKRYTSEELQDWLYEYTIGELWKKNIIKGRP